MGPIGTTGYGAARMRYAILRGGNHLRGVPRITMRRSARGQGAAGVPFSDHPSKRPPSYPWSYLGGGRGGAWAVRNVPRVSQWVAVHRGTSRGGGGAQRGEGTLDIWSLPVVWEE